MDEDTTGPVLVIGFFIVLGLWILLRTSEVISGSVFAPGFWIIVGIGALFFSNYFSESQKQSRRKQRQEREEEERKQRAFKSIKDAYEEAKRYAANGDAVAEHVRKELEETVAPPPCLLAHFCPAIAAEYDVAFKEPTPEDMTAQLRWPSGRVPPAIEVYYQQMFNHVYQQLPLNIEEPGDASFLSFVLELLPDPIYTIHQLTYYSFMSPYNEIAELDYFRERARARTILVDDVDLYDQHPGFDEPAPWIAKAPGPPVHVAKKYLDEGPALYLLASPVGITIPDEARFEHMHVCAGTGGGKTQLAQTLILRDLERVADGSASLVVIDSQRDMVERIANLKIFGKGEPLEDKLVYINAEDVEYPPALNIFDVQMERIKTYSLRDREQLINGAIETLEYVFTSLAAEMTQKQQLIVQFLIRLLIHIPDATIFTLAELLKRDGYVKYEQYVEQMDDLSREFFETEFKDEKQFGETKRQIQRRLWGILTNGTFARMFSNPRNKVDLYHALNTGHVVLINTAKDILKEDASGLFGKFIIAQLAQCGQERATIAEHKRLPTFVYVDEAADYFSPKVEVMLSQLRKYKIGGCFMHQHLDQLAPSLQSSMFANTSVRLAGNVSARDARTLAPQLRTTPEYIMSMPKLSFAGYIRNVSDQAFRIQVKPGTMESRPTLSEEERTELNAYMRERYCTPYSETRVEETPEPEEESEPATERVPMGFQPPQKEDDIEPL